MQLYMEKAWDWKGLEKDMQRALIKKTAAAPSSVLAEVTFKAF